MWKSLAFLAAVLGAWLVVAAGPALANNMHVNCGVNPANPDCKLRTPTDPALNRGVPPRPSYTPPPPPPQSRTR